VLIRDLRPKSVSEWIGGRVQPAKAAEGSRERRRVEIGVGSQMLTDLGVRDMVLLTNSPAHVYVGLEGFGLRIVGTRRIE
jgi:3,4-dihydroxy 2-butanone 4-phosphate synthase/GTP cyclohydrolase II